ncbi:MAG: lipocalin family protein [Luteimonas sp.]
MRMRRLRSALPSTLLAVLLSGTAACAPARVPVPPVAHVDLQRYMGRWYVIASIPTRFERDTYNAVETYRLQDDGTICTTFRYRPGGFDAAVKQIQTVASVTSGSNDAEWRVHVLGLLRMQYVVAWLKPDYSQVIVARDKRDYVWVMARTPSIPAEDYAAMLESMQAMGYDLSALVKSPQQWPEVPAAPESFEKPCD